MKHTGFVIISLTAFFVSVPCNSQEAPRKLTTDTPSTTSTGTSFTAPGAWSTRSTGAVILLDAPEVDSHLALVDVQAATPEEAAAAAWAKYRPDAKWPVKLVTKDVASDGWAEKHSVEYEVSPNEKRVVAAQAYRANYGWTVVILDSAQAGFEKRLSQFLFVLETMRPKGHERESFAGRKALPLTEERIRQLTSFVETAMIKLGTPGAAMALIDHNRIVFEGGFGVRELGKPERVDENTLFMAASNTKGMTTLMLARLVDQSKIRWDQSAHEIFPAFRLADAELTKKVLVKHLICACTGMPRQDYEWLFEGEKQTPASALESLSMMKPTTAFGEVFQYSNVMATAAGYLGAHVYAPDKEYGGAYAEAMQKLVFDPLGMNSTTFDVAKALAGNHASPHSNTIDAVPMVVPMNLNETVIPEAPAGAVWTSAHDFIRYVQLELNKGKLPDGTTLVSETNILERRKPQVALGADGYYGMGLMVDNKYKVPVVHHGGDLAGFHSDLMFLPEQQMGAVILTNSDSGVYIRGPLMRRMLEVLFDGRPEAEAQIDSAAASYRTGIFKERARLTFPPTPADSEKLADRYISKELGELVVRRGDAPMFDSGAWVSPVASRKNDDGTLSFVTVNSDISGLEFVVSNKDGKKSLITRDAQHEYVFTEER